MTKINAIGKEKDPSQPKKDQSDNKDAKKAPKIVDEIKGDILGGLKNAFEGVHRPKVHY